MITEMLIADILKLPSVDSSGNSKSVRGWTVAETLEETNVFYKVYDKISAEMERDGYNRVPLHVDYAPRMAEFYYSRFPEELMSSKALGNGHHRLVLMIELGFTHARVTDDPAESDDTGEDQYLRGYDREPQLDYADYYYS